MVVEEEAAEMQNLENLSQNPPQLVHHSQVVSQVTGHQHITPPELVFPRHNDVETNVQAKKFGQPLIVDETKQYMEGIVPDEDEDEDGEPEAKYSRGSPTPGAPGGVRQKKTRGRVKIKMEFIQNKLRRYTTFSKRKTGIMKKSVGYRAGIAYICPGVNELIMDNSGRYGESVETLFLPFIPPIFVICHSCTLITWVMNRKESSSQAYELSTLTGTQVMLLVASETGHVYTFATRKLQPMITSESGKALIQTCLNSPDPSLITNQNANPSDQRMSQTGYEEPDLQYSTNDEDVKPSNPGTVLTGIQLAQPGHNFPMTTYVAPAVQHPQSSRNASSNTSLTVQAVAGGGLTAIVAPTGNLATAPVQVQTAAATTQPSQQQVIQGQLQMHKIHPQNIILTGPGVQPGHIILNAQAGASTLPLVIQDNTSQSSPPVTVTSGTSAASSGQENVITIFPSELSSGGAVQMVYNTPQGLVYAAPSNIVHTDSHGNAQTNPSETVTIHHQASGGTYHIQQDVHPGTNVLQVSQGDTIHRIMDGTIVVGTGHPHNDLSKQDRR